MSIFNVTGIIQKNVVHFSSYYFRLVKKSCRLKKQKSLVDRKFTILMYSYIYGDEKALIEPTQCDLYSRSYYWWVLKLFLCLNYRLIVLLFLIYFSKQIIFVTWFRAFCNFFLYFFQYSRGHGPSWICPCCNIVLIAM